MMDAPSYETDKKLESKKWTKNNKRHQEQTNRNVRSYPGDTTIRNCVKSYSRPDNQIRTSPGFPCHSF